MNLRLIINILGSVLKVTVAVLPETYSEAAGSGGSIHIEKVRSGYGAKVSEAMEQMHQFDEGALQAEGDVSSAITVVYYFDAQTFAPLAAVYTTVTDTAQKINVYQSEEEVGTVEPAGYVRLRIVNTLNTYYFFD